MSDRFPSARRACLNFLFLSDNRTVEKAPPGKAGIGLVLAVTLLTLAIGYVVKRPCLTDEPWNGRQYTTLCYSDVAALYGAEGLDRNLVPYLEHDNEYPVLTGFTMWLASLPADSFESFFNWTAVLLGAAALVTAWLLNRLAGDRALYFALAPTLAAYAFMNWDLLAVVLAMGGTITYLKGRDRPTGILLGLGAAAKLYPALLVVPFVLGRLREKRWRDAVRIAGWATGAWLVVNLPVAITNFDRWSEFFRFNSERPVDWDSLWFIANRHGAEFSTTAVNVLSALFFVAVSALLWRLAAARRPDFPAWTFGFPIVVTFLLTSKVYSPQFSLWLLPWFALALPDPRYFIAFSVADIAVFVTRFPFFASLDGTGGLPFEAFEVALLVRAAVLVACLVAWVRRQVPASVPTVEPAREAV